MKRKKRRWYLRQPKKKNREGERKVIRILAKTSYKIRWVPRDVRDGKRTEAKDKKVQDFWEEVRIEYYVIDQMGIEEIEILMYVPRKLVSELQS